MNEAGVSSRPPPPPPPASTHEVSRAASLGCYRRPAWNHIAKAFKDNSKVVFGDVNLAEDQVQGRYAGSPGAGGWPTIRAYNNETGYDGVFAGDWKEENSLEGAMCDVFGKEETMQRYVEEMAGISSPGVFVGGVLCSTFECLCEQKDGSACSKQEESYFDKFKAAPLADVHSRLKLLSASLAKSASKDAWMQQRVTILKLLASMRAPVDGDKQEL